MKIITWNCGGNFRKKFRYIEKYNADILVIQECESIDKIQSANQTIFNEYNFEWINDGSQRTDKGLGIFLKKSIVFKKQNWETFGLNHYLAVKIENKFDLIGILTENPGYIRDACVYLQMYEKLFTNKSENVLLCGDLNSFKKDKYTSKTKNIETYFKELYEMNIHSCYHDTYDKKLGDKEELKTFISPNGKRYHIDYIFTNMEYSGFFIEDFDNFKVSGKNISDHVPLGVNVDIYPDLPLIPPMSYRLSERVP